MKKLLLTSLIMLCASLTYAGSGCGGGGCDSDKKDGKADFSQDKIVLAGGCGGCGDKKDKKDKAPKADFSENKTVLAGGCGGCGDKKDKKDGKSDFTAQFTAIV